MRTKVIFLVLGVLMLSFLPAYVSGISTPDKAAAETAERSALLEQSVNPAMPAVEPAGVSPRATPIRNLWGAPKGEKVELTPFRSGNVVGWSWSRQHPITRPSIGYIQPIYPNARIVLKSPVTIGEIQSFKLVADFQYTQGPSGNYSLVYDVFLREPGTKAEKAEVMVVLDRTQPHPMPPVEGSYSDGYNSYKLYSWKRANGCAFRSFRLETPSGTIPIPVNLKALIDLIQPEKDWYISEVELGTEVWSGSGTVELTTYYLELNGSRL